MQKCNMGKILASKLDLMMDWIMWDLRGRCQGWIWDFWILQWKRLNRAHLFCWRSTSSQGQSWSIFEKFKRRGIAQCYIQSGDHELKKIKKRNPIYHCIKYNKLPRNKFNQGGERLLTLKTVRFWWKKLKTQINGKIHCAHELGKN